MRHRWELRLQEGGGLWDKTDPGLNSSSSPGRPLNPLSLSLFTLRTRRSYRLSGLGRCYMPETLNKCFLVCCQTRMLLVWMLLCQYSSEIHLACVCAICDSCRVLHCDSIVVCSAVSPVLGISIILFPFLINWTGMNIFILDRWHFPPSNYFLGVNSQK